MKVWLENDSAPHYTGIDTLTCDVAIDLVDSQACIGPCTDTNVTLSSLETGFFKIPGSHVVARYVRSSHQNDPGRTVLEILLFIFAVRTLLQSRTRSDHAAKHFIKFDERVSWLPHILV